MAPPITFAHRGARADAPENTLVAFRLALELGARGLESDARLSADGQVVLVHGPTAHQGWRRLKVAQATAEQLAGLEVPRLADLYREQKKFAKAKECYDRAISTRTDSPDPFYRRGLCEIELNDFAAAATDLEHVVNKDRNYDYQRASGLLAYAWAQTGQPNQAASLFGKITETSTLSETQYNYACFLAAQGQAAEAKQWAHRILAKKATMPRYLKRRERPWFRKAASLLKRLPHEVAKQQQGAASAT